MLRRPPSSTRPATLFHYTTLFRSDHVVGSWFYVMGMVDGHTIWDGAMPGSTPENRRATYFAMIDTLAALHGVDVEAAGLSDYGKLGNYFGRSEEHTSELQSLMRISYAVFCLKKKKDVDQLTT